VTGHVELSPIQQDSKGTEFLAQPQGGHRALPSHYLGSWERQDLARSSCSRETMGHSQPLASSCWVDEPGRIQAYSW
jgi:hypothetical protein